jgi:hypothetical protein
MGRGASAELLVLADHVALASPAAGLAATAQVLVGRRRDGDVVVGRVDFGSRCHDLVDLVQDVLVEAVSAPRGRPLGGPWPRVGSARPESQPLLSGP